MRDSKRRNGLIATAALLGGVLTLSACGGGSSEAAQAKTKQVDAAAAKATSDAKIKITPKDGTADAGINSDAKVTVSGGKLTEVTMTAVESKKAVEGTLSADGTSWQPKKSLDRSTKYTVSAHATDAQGRKAVENATFTTVSPAHSFIGTFTPEDGSTVGVGMPVSVNFDKPVQDKKAVESAIKVASSSNQKVVGHWFGDQRLDFRPEEYWKANSKVTMELGLDGVQASPGVQGVQHKTVTFTVGHSQISTVDAKTHQMTVVRDGKTIKTIPISAGSAEHPTYNGKMVISEKYQQTRMNGSTVGFGGEYDIPDVPHAMRLSNSGTFIHGNYWGKGIFGNSNTSHGCIGLADAKGAGDPGTDGAWFFANSQLGDVVQMINSPDRTIKPDNGLNGWNMNWSEWVAGSALK
ncbi:L,D-transpeptidase [Streptomyces celluloflavus]|uniref:L,D-transpeptidase n=1 Tax=Streptomyces TaxID=1883 RepID=UPI000DA61F7F|nr:Ig-like domain-containing protein [Streptomyces sp. SID7805]MYU52837.1 L,D-transpeptidase family protein [Streptomyces sp. SID7805]